MKLLPLLLSLVGLMFAKQLQEGNYEIRFEPVAKLQSGAQIPFQITVQDDLRKPLSDAKVTLQIETTDHQKSKTYAAPAVNPGLYLAKPVFPSAGQWSVYVEVRRNDRMSARIIEFNVPE